MELNRKKGLIVSFYLSKFNRNALEALNYKSFKEAFEDVGKKLNIPRNTIKNRRDDFDSVNDNNRKGWYQKELSKSSLEVVENFDGLSEDALTEIVKDILMVDNEQTDTLIEILKEGVENSVKREYNSRGVTGKQAEQLFIEYFKQGFFGVFSGELIDTRDDGCGYDFKISSEEGVVFEVKGLSNEDGGVSFTDKEWLVAKELRSKYRLVIISNVFQQEPIIRVVSDPYQNIKPTKRLTQSISVNWNFQTKQVTF